MDPALLKIAAAFGLSAAAGLNVTLPLLLVGLAARTGTLSLAAPFDALASDVALIGLLVVAVLEFFADKVPHLDSAAHALLFPLSVAAGAVLFAAETGVVVGAHPGAQIVIGLLAGGATAGIVHVMRASLRPLANIVWLGPLLSIAEDALAVTLAATAVLAPLLVPLVLVGGLILLALLVRKLVKLGGSIFDRIRHLLSGRGHEDDGQNGPDTLDWLDDRPAEPDDGQPTATEPVSGVPTPAAGPRQGAKASKAKSGLLGKVRDLVGSLMGRRREVRAGASHDMTWLDEEPVERSRIGR